MSVDTVPTSGSAGIASSERASAPTRRFFTKNDLKRPTFRVGLAALVLGLVLGTLITRQRYHNLEVVAAVNGKVITRDEFFRRLENSSGDAVIRQIAGEELYTEFARKVGKYPSEQAVDQRLQQVMADPQAAARLQASHLALDDIRRAIRTQMAREMVLSRDISVTDAEVQQFYQQNIDPKNPDALYYTPESAQIAIIVTPTLEQCEKAQDAISHGIPFQNAAAIYSVDPTRANNGMMQAPIYKGRTTSKNLPQLEQAIFDLKIGQESAPVKVGSGWWLIHCYDRQPASVQSFQQVKEQATLGAQLSKLSTANRAELERQFVDFQKHATIQAFWTRYTKALDFKSQ